MLTFAEIAAAKERLFVLTEAVLNSSGRVEHFGTLFPGNSRALPSREWRARTDHHHAARRGAARAHPTCWLAGRPLHGLGGHTLNPIARDGIPLSRMGLTVPRKPDQPTDYPGAMLMAPGQRIDVLVQAGKPGTYAFRAAPYDEGYAAPTGPIARLVVEGDPLPINLPAKLPTLPEKLIGDEEITGTRLLTFSQARVDIERAEFWQTFRFMVDGKTFDADRVDQRVRLGAVEEWTIISDRIWATITSSTSTSTICC